MFKIYYMVALYCVKYFILGRGRGGGKDPKYLPDYFEKTLWILLPLLVVGFKICQLRMMKTLKIRKSEKTELIYEEANVTFMRVGTKLLSKIITKKYIFLFLASWRRLRYPSLLMSQYENPMILWTAVENFCNLGMLLSFYLYITLDILFIWTIKIIKYRLLVSSLSAMFSYCSVGRTG